MYSKIRRLLEIFCDLTRPRLCSVFCTMWIFLTNNKFKIPFVSLRIIGSPIIEEKV